MNSRVGAAVSQKAQAITSENPTGAEIAIGTPHSGQARDRRPSPGRSLGRSQLDLRGAQLVIALRIGSRRWIEEQPHELIMARAPQTKRLGSRSV